MQKLNGKFDSDVMDKLADIESCTQVFGVRAPGKTMLFDEHAVLYGKAAIVSAIDRSITVYVGKSHNREDQNYIEIYSPQMSKDPYRFSKTLLATKNFPKEFRYVGTALKTFLQKYKKEIKNGGGLKFVINSEFGDIDAVSLGTSSAVTVATVGALRELYRKLIDSTMTLRNVFDISYESHNEVQNKMGSGFDIAAGTWGGTLKYKNRGEEITPLPVKPLKLVYVPIPKNRTETPLMIEKVAKEVKKNPELYESTWRLGEDITLQAEDSLKAGNDELTGALMYRFHTGVLESIGVSTQVADMLVRKSMEAGAYGAKMTGGYGDNIIALTPEQKIGKVIEELKKYKVKPTLITTNTEGLRTVTH